MTFIPVAAFVVSIISLLLSAWQFIRSGKKEKIESISRAAEDAAALYDAFSDYRTELLETVNQIQNNIIIYKLASISSGVDCSEAIAYLQHVQQEFSKKLDIQENNLRSSNTLTITMEGKTLNPIEARARLASAVKSLRSSKLEMLKQASMLPPFKQSPDITPGK